MAYKDILRKRSRTSHSKKNSREEKTKTPAKDKSHTPELEISLHEHEIPKDPEVPTQLDAPKLKGVVFKEPTSQPKSLPAPVEGKGKGVFVEPPRPFKKQKFTPVCEQRQAIPDPEVITRREVDTRENLSLSNNAGATGQEMAVDLMTRVARSLSTVSSNLWEQFKDSDTHAQVELEIHFHIVVCIYLLHFFALTFLLFQQFLLSSFPLSLFQASLNLLGLHASMSHSIKLLTMDISTWENIFKASTSKYETDSKKQKDEITMLKESVDRLKTAKGAVEEELKREKTSAKETRRVLDEARKNADEANKALLASEEAEKNLEAHVDFAKAQAKLAKDAFAKTEAEVEQRINAGKDDLIDLAMYIFWVANQNADISFMEDEVEALLAKLKVRLKEEKEFRSITVSEGIAETRVLS